MEKYYQRGIYPSTYKIIVIGDLHGDYRATISSLLKGKIINKKLKWIAGKTNVIQMGDIFDRIPRTLTQTDEDSEFKILKLLIKLQKEAYKVGGALHCLMGNHELLNILGFFKYVSPLGIKHFKKGLKERKEYFKPGGTIAKLLAKTWNSIIKIGKFVFVHGGISKFISIKYKNNFKVINQLMRLFLLGNTKLYNKNEFKELFLDDTSLLWNREYSMGKLSKKKCKEIITILKNLKIKYIVVGHTPQSQGINIECNIWRTDTGMSEAFGKFSNNRIQLLEIIRNGNSFKIIK